MDVRCRWRRAVLQQGLEKERVLTGLKTEPGTHGTAAEAPENRWHLEQEQEEPSALLGSNCGGEMGFPAFPASQLFQPCSHPCIPQRPRAWWQSGIKMKMMQSGFDAIALPPISTQRIADLTAQWFLPGKADQSRDCIPLQAFPWLCTPSQAWEGLAWLWQGGPWAPRDPKNGSSGTPTWTHTHRSFLPTSGLSSNSFYLLSLTLKGISSSFSLKIKGENVHLKFFLGPQ